MAGSSAEKKQRWVTPALQWRGTRPVALGALKDKLRHVRGQGDLLHAARRRGADRPRGRLLRFAGCNLWSGREQDRADAICKFCDTDFVGTDGPGGGKFADAEDLATRLPRCGAAIRHPPYVVCTGGEPLLQLDAPLIAALHAQASKSPSRPTARLPRRGDRLDLRQPQGDSAG